MVIAFSIHLSDFPTKVYRRFYQRLSSDRLRRLICGTLLAVLGVGMTGFAVPQASIKRAGSTTERFPCETCRCGCSTAEFCWDQCCCHSDEEKLRWAQRNEVEPPRFLIERVAARAADPIAGDPSITETPACCCCSQPKRSVAKPPLAAIDTTKNRCVVQAQATTGASSPDPLSDPDPASEPADSEIGGLRFVNLESVAKCRGIEMVWTLLSQIVVPTPRESLRALPRVLDRLTATDELAESIFLPVDSPVPWCE